ncbi:MAG: DUF1501 domain-containing protein [Spirosomaceae bacterium]|jgi:uncharacterized protein (DUF1501 family)|nr:DUF1501 domain-containing protein [Spirosomataceae bacterium]
MKRRNFIKNTLPLVAAPLVSNNLFASVPNPLSLGSQLFSIPSSHQDRILVIINLFGGNDGLSTVYNEQPNTSGNPTTSLLYNGNGERKDLLGINDYQINNSLFFNKMIADLINLNSNNKLKIIHGVGSPGNTGSHFGSDDIFQMGLRGIADLGNREGIIGKYFKKANYPNSIFPPNTLSPPPTSFSTPEGPLAVHVGNRTPRSFFTSSFNQYYTVSAGFSNTQTGFGFRQLQACNYYQDELDFVNSQFNSTKGYNDRILDAYMTGIGSTGSYPSNSVLTALQPTYNTFINSMKLIETLIKGGLGSRIYTVNINGFDTHSNQTVQHNALLKTLNDGINHFVNNFDGSSYAVLGVTFSEFGRRIMQNGTTSSAGSDHGHSSPTFLFGATGTFANSNTNVLGYGGLFNGFDSNSQPTFMTQGDISGGTNTKIEHDYREVYSAIFQKWFGLPTTDLTDIIAVDTSLIQNQTTLFNHDSSLGNNLTNVGKIMQLII